MPNLGAGEDHPSRRQPADHAAVADSALWRQHDREVAMRADRRLTRLCRKRCVLAVGTVRRWWASVLNPCNLSGRLSVIESVSTASGTVTATSANVRRGVSAEDLEALYRTERDRMVRLALLLVGSVPDAEELVQESFVRVARARQPLDNPPAYLRTTVVNLSRSHLRHLRVQRRQLATVPRLVENPDLDETWVAVCRLPFRQRAAVVLRYYEDLPEAEIASLLSCRLGTVKSNLHHALASLRKELSATSTRDDVIEKDRARRFELSRKLESSPGRVPGLSDGRRPRVARRVTTVLVAAAIVVVFFVPLPHVSLFHGLVAPAKTTPASTQTVTSAKVTPTAVTGADGYLWMLGTYPCASGTCPVLMRSSDGGKSWVWVGTPPAGCTSLSLRTARTATRIARIPPSTGPRTEESPGRRY